MDSLKHVAGRSFNFKAHGHRYVLDVYRGHKTTVMGGNDWVKFVADFNLGAGALVAFDTSKRTTETYVAHLGFAHLANDGDPDEDIVADEDEVGEGAGVEVFNIESDENDDHEEADARELVYTHGCVLTDAEGSLLDVVLTNNDGFLRLSHAMNGVALLMNYLLAAEEKCCYLEWIDPQWSVAMQFCIGQLWGMHDKENDDRIKEHLKLLGKEKRKMEEELRFFQHDFAKLVADKEEAINQLGSARLAISDLKEEIEKKKLAHHSSTNLH
ncbi:cbl-interacting protein kinase 13 [Hordeum vulgare]|nr:cbl-interacting protein kinase 13 [Hordeum vulgare]